MSKNLYLGVDGGGTKTRAAVADDQEKISGQGMAGSGNYRVVGLKQASHNINQAIRAALSRAGARINDVQSAFFGLGSINSSTDQKMWAREIKRVYGKKIKYLGVANDTVIALHSGTKKGFGCAVIAGTGSNCYAVNTRGETAWTGGLGRLFADQGSAYWLAREMFKAIGKSFDGRGEKSILEQLYLRQIGSADIRSSLSKLNEYYANKTRLASLAPLVERAANQGDTVARKILQEAAAELSLMARVAIKKVGLQKIKFNLVMAGSVWNVKILRDEFKQEVKRAVPLIHFVRPKDGPTMGAIRLAIRQAESSKL